MLQISTIMLKILEDASIPVVRLHPCTQLEAEGYTLKPCRSIAFPALSMTVAMKKTGAGILYRVYLES